jgi:hypothetical protein
MLFPWRIVWLCSYKNDRPLTISYAVEDGQRLLLEDVTWREERAARGVVDDFEDDELGAAASGAEADDAARFALASGAGSFRIYLALSEPIAARVKLARPDIDFEQLMVKCFVNNSGHKTATHMVRARTRTHRQHL